MTPETDRLLEQLAEFRTNPQLVGTQQPRFTAWLTSVRHWLRSREDREGLRHFESLRMAKTTGAMWRRDETSPAEVRELLSELDRVEDLLRRETEGVASEPAIPTPARQQAGKAPSGTTENSPGSAPERKTREETPVKEKTHTEDALQPQLPASPPTRFKAMEVLLGELEQELKRPDGDVAKIQRMMAELLDLKKMGHLIDKVFASASDPACPWETVRGPLAQLWAVNREVVVDLLPTLLKKG